MGSELLTFAIHAGDVKELREPVRTRPYDFGCRPSAIYNAKGDYIPQALLNWDQYQKLKKDDCLVDILFEGVLDDRAGPSNDRRR
jgi:hypothetical protein